MPVVSPDQSVLQEYMGRLGGSIRGYVDQRFTGREPLTAKPQSVRPPVPRPAPQPQPQPAPQPQPQQQAQPRQELLDPALIAQIEQQARQDFMLMQLLGLI